MSPINLTDTNDPHHSLLHKPNKATEEDDRLLADYEKRKNAEAIENAEIKKTDEKIYWWGKPRK